MLLLDFNEIHNAGLAVIADGLRHNTTLTCVDQSVHYNEIVNNYGSELSLAGNKFGSSGADALWNALTENTALAVLDLMKNTLNSDEIAQKPVWFLFCLFLTYCKDL